MAGALAQSIGGHGGNGGYAGSVFVATGGAANPGGNGGLVKVGAQSVDGKGQVKTFGDASSGLVAQSIGGGGGYGGDAHVAGVFDGLAQGGIGAAGGNGGLAQVINGVAPGSPAANWAEGQIIQTNGIRSAGMVAQSIGGGGGVGGDSFSQTLVGGFSVAIGGSAGTGGKGGNVFARNAGVVVTDGDLSQGVLLQSIGGGGGNGGAAMSMEAGVGLNTATAVGGSGGNGGTGGDIDVANYRQITTNGRLASGLLAQTIGGGGGNGGSSISRLIDVFPPTPDVPVNPSIDVSVSIGGKGGTGGHGGNIVATNAGSIITNNTGSRAVQLMSIGGGGGNGGSADAFKFALQAPVLSVETAIGGTAGAGGRGGAITLTNSNGSIETYGDDAIAVSAQSIGGGGGNGGESSSRDLNLVVKEKVPTVAVTLAVGGAGGLGNVGGDVTVNNLSGRIATMGIGSRAILAQSIGGGGGVGGGAAAMGSGATGARFDFNIGVGGSGGSGNDGGKVTVANAGTIYTRNGNSAGIFAQSVGGGGGAGGSGAGEAGLSGSVAISNFLAQRAGIGDDVVEVGDKVYEVVNKILESKESIEHIKEIFEAYEKAAESEPTTPAHNSIPSLINVNVGGGFGGGGGAGGSGNTVTVNNSGTVATDGDFSDAIFAQSIGGGGGDGGGALSSAEGVIINANFAVGGRGGSSGNGGNVTVTSSSGATTGDLSHGVNAQSIGGGGGRGGGTVAKWGAGSELSLSLGGDGGANGSGGAVDVTSADLSTSGDGSIGILAQSIGGGGGQVALFGTAVSEGGEAESEFEPNVVLGAPTIKVGGKEGAAGNGGTVTVTQTGALATAGRDAYGILAQSIGGGGGVVFSPRSAAEIDKVDEQFGEGKMSGIGGTVTAALKSGASITTQGDGAVGILAQSIGGGGGLVGGMSDVDVHQIAGQSSIALHEGAGGAVTVKTEAGSSISTAGVRAHGIVAQSVTGGGFFAGEDATGFSVRNSFTVCDSCSVTLDLNSIVQASGDRSYSVYAQTGGQGAITMNIGSAGILSAPREADATIYIEGDGKNVINNSGHIYGGEKWGVALDGSTTTINNHGFILGNINTRFPDGTQDGHLINNYSDGTLWTQERLMVRQLTNQGTLVLGSVGDPSFLTGSLVSTGDIVTMINPDGNASSLAVGGSASVQGRILVVGWSPSSARTSTILTAEYGLIATGAISALPATYNSTTQKFSAVDSIYYFDTSIAFNSLTLTGHLKSASQLGGSLSGNQREAADALSRMFEAGPPAAALPAYDALFHRIGSAGGYIAALDTIGGQAIGQLAADRLTMHRGFINSMMSCPSFVEEGAMQQERSCAWARASGSWIDNDRDVGSKSDSRRYQMGGQIDVGGHWFLGASGDYEDIDITSAVAASQFKGDAFSLGVYAKHEAGRLLIGGSLSGSVADYGSRREVAFGDSAALANPKVQNLAAQLRISYQIPQNGWYLRPSLDLTTQYIHMDSFLETGSGLPLEILGGGDWSASISPSMELSARMQVGGTVFRPFVQLGAIYQTSGDWTHRVKFAGTGQTFDSFQSRIELPNAMARLAAGIEGYSRGGLTIKAQYEGELSNGYRAHSAVLRLGYSF